MQLKVLIPLLVHFIFIQIIVFAKDKTITVAQDGSGNYTTVQAALNAVPHNNKNPIIIYIKNGVYKEKLYLDSSKSFVTLKGEDRFSTILTYDDHAGKLDSQGKKVNTNTSCSFLILAKHFTAMNITFQNDAGFNAGQAVAVQVNGDQAQFLNCRFVGYQDVLFTNDDNSHQYYKDCYIEGTTDFIFGSSTVWFEKCHIHSKKNSHVTAASTPKEHAYGYVFYDCVLTGDTTLHSVSLGRPWQPYSSVTYIHCYVGPHILPAGWSNWGKVSNETTARYSEYKNYGPGASSIARVPWSKQLTDEEVKRFTLHNVLNGWIPEGSKP